MVRVVFETRFLGSVRFHWSGIGGYLPTSAADLEVGSMPLLGKNEVSACDMRAWFENLENDDFTNARIKTMIDVKLRVFAIKSLLARSWQFHLVT